MDFGTLFLAVFLGTLAARTIAGAVYMIGAIILALIS